MKKHRFCVIWPPNKSLSSLPTTYNHQVHDDELDFGRLDDVHWNGCDDDQLDDCDEDPLDYCDAWHANGELDDLDDDWRDGCDENWLVLDDAAEAEVVDEDVFDSDAGSYLQLVLILCSPL